MILTQLQFILLAQMTLHGCILISIWEGPFSADYRATQDIFYTTGAPDNNSERQVVWTPVYDPQQGKVCWFPPLRPYTHPITGYMGIIGIDVEPGWFDSSH